MGLGALGAALATGSRGAVAQAAGYRIDGLSVFADLDAASPLDEKSLAAAHSSGLTAINNTTPSPGDDFDTTLSKIDKLKSIVDVNNDVFRLVLSGPDLDASRADGKLGVIIGFQSTEMFAQGLETIATFHAAGARIMQMTYNGPGLFGQGCLSPSRAGLSEQGHEALQRMQALGVLVDVSHANQATTAATIAAAQRPLVVSHTGCNAIYQHPRNNDDRELRALADAGGVAGIYLMPFLDGGSGPLAAAMFFAHLDHALQVCGAAHVGIGSDQGVRPVDDGPEYRKRLRAEVEARKAAGISAPGESADRPPFIPEFNRSDRLLAIATAMQQRGYPAAVIEGVCGGNFARVMRDAWG
jgi:membrane dipeptidase